MHGASASEGRLSQAARRKSFRRPTRSGSPVPAAILRQTSTHATITEANLKKRKIIHLEFSLTQLLLLSMLFLCILANIWLWRRIQDLEQTSGTMMPGTGTSSFLQDELTRIRMQGLVLDDVQKQQLIQSLRKLRDLDTRVDTVATRMTSAEQELSDLMSELERERRRMSELLQKGLPKDKSTSQDDANVIVASKKDEDL